MRERHFAEIAKLDAVGNAGRSPAPYTHEIRRFKRELAEAHVQAFIETYQRLGRYPTEIDFEDFARELFDIVDRKGENLHSRFKRGLMAWPSDLAERIESQLGQEIRQDAAIALGPLRHFINEGKLVAAQQAVPVPQTDSEAFSERLREFQEYLGKEIETLSDLEWDATAAFLQRLPTTLARVDFLKALSKLPNDGVKDNIVINPTVNRRNQDLFLTPLKRECDRLLSSHFDLDKVLRQAEQIVDHADALEYLWKVLRSFTHYHPSIRKGSYAPDELAFYKGVENEIQFRKDLQMAKGAAMGKGGIYNLHDNSRVNIDSQDNSTNISQKFTENVFADAREAVQAQIQSAEERTLILSKLDALEESSGKGGFTLSQYQDFIAAAANHMTVLAPFIPALTKMLGG